MKIAISDTPSPQPDSPIFGKPVAVAGALAYFPESDPLPEREAFCRLLNGYGGSLAPSLTRDPACLVCNDTQDRAVSDARAMDIPVLSEEAFLALLRQGCAPAQPATDFTVENGVLLGYTGEAWDVIIPEGITDIHPGVFQNNTRIRSVTLPEGLRYIGSKAFSGCSGLLNVRLPSSLRHIGDYAFYKCSNLLFLSLPEGLETIGEWAFSQLYYLQAAVIPSTVTKIDDHAFYCCDRLKALNLRPGVRHIGGYAFSGCRSLRSLVIPAGAIMHEGAFSNCMVLGSLTLSAGITALAPNLFDGCAALTSLVIPAGISMLEKHSFSGCAGLRSVSLPDGLTHIGEGAFAQCGFESIHIPDSVVSIGRQAFYNSGLRSITVPEGVTALGSGAFLCCARLETVRLPQSLVTLGQDAFHKCTCLREINIPAGIEEVPEDLFYGCRSMADQDGFLISGSKLISVFLDGRTHLEIPPGMTALHDFVLFHFHALEHVTVPPGVTDLGRGFLHGLPSLKTLFLPPDITTLADNTLRHCQNLQLLRAPGLQPDILQARDLLLPAATGYLFDPEAFTDPQIATFYRQYIAHHRRELLPFALSEDQVSAVVTYAHLGQITAQNFETGFLQPALAANATGCVAFLMDWKNRNLPEINPEDLSSQLDGDVFNGDDMERLWRVTQITGGLAVLFYRGQAESVMIPCRVGQTPVLEIGPFALSPENGILPESQRQVLRQLKTVHLCPGITRIRANAFSGCPLLEKVTLPATVQAIDSHAFSRCPHLTIQAPAGSFAEAYAIENNIPFIAQ